MKNRLRKLATLFTLTIALAFLYKCDVHAAMTQDEATEWLKQWCEENGYNWEDFRGTGGTRDDLYVGNRTSSTANTSATQPAPTPTPTPKHEHKYTSNLTTNPTCTEEGVMTYTCTCGESYTEPYPALGHKYQSEITKKATCKEEGEKTFTCSLCKDTYTETIPKTDHKAGKEVVNKEATCTEAGEKKVFCEVCEAELSSEVIPATGHTESDWTVTKENGLFTKGEQVKTCTTCQEVLQTEVIESRLPINYLYIGAGAVSILLVAVFGVIVAVRKKKNKA